MTILDNYHSTKKIVDTLSINTKIIAVTKRFSIEKINPLIIEGHKDFGENKVQEAILKWKNILKQHTDLNLHLLGHLQSNKVSEAVNIFNYIHSLDTEKLANKFMIEENKVNKKHIEEIVFICKAGVRSVQAYYNIIEDNNRPDVVFKNLQGGIVDWISNKYELVK